MRNLIPVILVTLVMSFAVADAQAQNESALQDRIAARRNLSNAKYTMRNYWQFEYPRQRRDLDTEIELTEMELKNLNTRLREFRPFTRFSIHQPYPLTVRSYQMCIRATEARLDNLRAERTALIRFRDMEFAALAAQVAEARRQVLYADQQEVDQLPAPLPPQN